MRDVKPSGLTEDEWLKAIHGGVRFIFRRQYGVLDLIISRDDLGHQPEKCTAIRFVGVVQRFDSMPLDAADVIWGQILETTRDRFTASLRSEAAPPPPRDGAKDALGDPDAAL